MTAQAPVDGLIAGKYRLIRLLGRGAMGSVWEARHETLGSRVAIKFIEGELLDNPLARSRFETEARAAAQIDSKHAIRVDDYGVTEDGKPYIIMEVLEGEDLERRIQRLGRLTLQDTARVVQQVCRALEKAHGLGIVHRDLKPENIFLAKKSDDPEEVAKVLDFGIAKMVSGPARAKTKTGAMVGTLMYMSPEQLHGVDVDYRADLWALGVIAFQCVTATLPFSGTNETAIILSILSGPIPVPSQIAAHSSAAFDAWFARAVERDPARRFATARELADSLSMLAGGSAGERASMPSAGKVGTPSVNAYAGTIATPGAALTGPGLAAPPRSTQGSSGILFGTLAGGVALIALAAGVSAYFGFSGSRSDPATGAKAQPPYSAMVSGASTPQAPSAKVATIPISALPTSRPTAGLTVVELAPDDRDFVDTTGGAGWGNRCWVHIQSGQLGWAKAECDQAMASDPTSPQPRASLLYNLGLIEQRTGHVEAARDYYQQSLALRENAEVQASLRSLFSRSHEPSPEN